MNFTWITSSIGFPNFFKTKGASFELADFFRKMADASNRGISYSGAKKLFTISAHQVETKKAAFQEFGLLYVVPKSDRISVTPAGQQLLTLAGSSEEAEQSRRLVLLILCRALSRFQFFNPLPVGGNKTKSVLRSIDVLPYLSAYYLLHQLGGVLTVSEILGAMFGLQRMSDLPKLVTEIRARRVSHKPLSEVSGLPANRGTVENRKIYFMAHLGLDWQILRDAKANFYGTEEQAYELTEFGFELVETVLNEQWPGWKSKSAPPAARKFTDEADYFDTVVGQQCPEVVFHKDAAFASKVTNSISKGILNLEDIDNLKELPKREFEEGRKRLVTHVRSERNQSLVRAAKRQFKKKHGRVFCEICAFDFESRYGKRGQDFIEAHHKSPIGAVKGTVKIKTEDLGMVCSNCHRMLHRSPWATMEQLKETVLLMAKHPSALKA